ncbi:hypothetical protein GVN21_09795 [Caulobacter sp. SLTY]|uniref:hypothetical protein n=1 Tax=Caulobacter sp. SLTY TaxID=2683262 RepID=UPI0014133D95|nr:hypothetical protein [Caulobacter sp. SLTY]NBB15645.1 hypothetical protein [Caulobacter sp. SLTY]
MDRRSLFALAPALLAASAAKASAPAKGKEKEGSGQYVDLSPVALPIVVKGRLVNYVFASVRLNLSPSADAAKLRAKEPYFRDALVRAAHRTPFTNPKSYVELDVARLKASLLRDAGAIAGAKNFVSVTVSSQTPKQRTGLPRPTA